MAGMLAEDDDEDATIAVINIVPFVDIVLVLLIIFMLTSSIIARAAFTVDLPKAASGGDAVATTLNVVLSADGKLYLNGDPVALDELRARVEIQSRSDPELRAVIAADKASRYEHVIEVIDTVKGAGVTAFALNIERGHNRARR